MTVALSLAALLTVLCAVFIVGGHFLRRYMRQMERREQAWMQERKDLLDRLMFMADRPWEVPTPEPEPEPDDNGIGWPELEVEEAWP